MAKPHRTRKANATRARRRPVRPSHPTSTLAGFAEIWNTWDKPRCCDDPMHVPPPWSQIEPILHVAFRFMADAGSRSLTAWRPDALRTAFASLLDSDAPHADEMATAMATSLQLFAEMLISVDRWSGTEEQLEECLEVLDDVLEGPGLAFDFEAVEDEVQLAALNHLPLIRRMDALLTWLGESKPVTATGALKLAVLPDAASAIGLSVAARRRGRPSAPEAAAAAQPGHHLHLVTDEEIRPALVDVTSMWEVPELALAWHCMQMIGLIEVGRTQARSADPSAIWCSGPPTDQISLRQQAVVHLLMAQLQQVEGWGSARDIMKGIHFAALYTAVNGLQVNEDDLISLGRKIGPPVWEDSLPGLVGNILQRYRREGLLVATNLGNQMPAGVKPAVACALTAFDLLQSEIDS